MIMAQSRSWSCYLIVITTLALALAVSGREQRLGSGSGSSSREDCCSSGSGFMGGYPRFSRGFKNAPLSTARGFGKRDNGDGGAALLANYPLPIALSLMNAARGGRDREASNLEGWTAIPASARLLEEIQSNPKLLARFMAQRMGGEVGDGDLMPEEAVRKAAL